ncbi:DUF1566 domain-containing protein [Methylotuvimicrobium sp. KM2]|uniref:Lcl C-terminal domain-containing protein n=1 Tax=Methylotuvimicrobium sp. KM2 TaxID=3133976 RepID=UPI003101A1AE
MSISPYYLIFDKTIIGFRLIALMFLMLGLSTHALANCNDARNPRTTPNQMFIIHDDGTVTHNATTLMWMRCLLGQVWDGNACSGSAQIYIWQDALQAANGYSFAGYNDWRLPNKNELISIVERACIGPAINSTVFPYTSNLSTVWSSSQPPDLSSYAFIVEFDSGHTKIPFKTSYSHVRLVRGGL